MWVSAIKCCWFKLISVLFFGFEYRSWQQAIKHGFRKLLAEVLLELVFAVIPKLRIHALFEAIEGAVLGLTTLDSVKKLKQGLLADGQLAKFEAHYSRPAAIFNDNHIWVIEDSVGRPAFDAKNAQEQIAMSLLGRKQDELSHVFVNSVFEDVEDFWFPTRYSQEIETGKLGSRLDCKNAQVILAQIPFVRMRRSVNPQLISSLQNLSFSDVVSALERANDVDMVVELNRQQRCISVIDSRVSLTPKEFAFYEWILGLAAEGLVIDREFESKVEISKSYLQHYRHVANDVRIYHTFGIEPEDYAQGAMSQLKGMNREFVQTLSSSINRKFKNKLPIELVDKLSVKTIAVPAPEFR